MADTTTIQLDPAAVEVAARDSWITRVYIGVHDGLEHEIPIEEVQRRDAEHTALRQANGEDIVLDQWGEHVRTVEVAITAFIGAIEDDLREKVEDLVNNAQWWQMAAPGSDGERYAEEAFDRAKADLFALFGLPVEVRSDAEGGAE